MRIGIDANEANVKNRVGISEYAFQIILKLYEFREKGENDHAYTIYLKSIPIDSLPAEKSWWKYKVVLPKKFWTQLGLPLTLLNDRSKLDIFFTLTHYAPRFSLIPTVVSVMDLSFLYFPETFKKRDLFKLTKWTEYSVKKARRVVTISESSKNDIINLYKIEPDKISVVHLGIKKINMEHNSKKVEDYGVDKKYILFVGTLQPRKNISKLIEAYSLLPDKLKDEYKLVVVGKKGWLYEDILDSPKKFDVRDNVLFLDYVTDNDLPQFYKNATVFVLPSLYEGFGLPVLEAMSYDCPVIASNVSSLPEAGGDACLYFDPTDAKDIKEKIEKVLQDSSLRQEMIEKGREHFKKFTWEKAAKEVLQTLEDSV